MLVGWAWEPKHAWAEHRLELKPRTFLLQGSRANKWLRAAPELRCLTVAHSSQFGDKQPDHFWLWCSSLSYAVIRKHEAVMCYFLMKSASRGIIKIFVKDSAQRPIMTFKKPFTGLTHKSTQDESGFFLSSERSTKQILWINFKIRFNEAKH